MTSLLIITAIMIVITLLARHMRANSRRHFVERYTFPSSVKRKLGEAYPGLDPQQLSLILQGMRDYFLVIQLSPKKQMVAMPSRGVDIAWHEFILCTRAYAEFCQRAFGYFLHHTPAEGMATPTIARKSLKLAWKLACKREGINPLQPDRLPLLFAIDSQLGIANGFFYHLPDIANLVTADSRDASGIGCTGGCSGGLSGSGSDSSSDSCSDSTGDCGDSGGGDGCGGGCGGGGD